jgi:hypothetical protein
LPRSCLAVAGNDDYASPSFTPTAAGTYRWVAGYSGGGHNRPAGPTACNDVAEAAIVRPAAVVPAVLALSTDDCAKAATFTATAEMNGETGPAAFIVTQPGTHRWVATYLGAVATR